MNNYHTTSRNIYTQGISNPSFPVARLLVIGNGERLTDIKDMCKEANIRVLGVCKENEAEQYLAKIMALDIVWLEIDAPVSRGLTRCLIAEVKQRPCKLICDTPEAYIDGCYADFGDLAGVQFVSRANQIEVCVALSAALSGQRPQLNDPGGDTALEHIEQLREEMTRIGSMLTRLIMGPEGHRIERSSSSNFGFADLGRSDNLDSLMHSPSRSFTSEPDWVGRAAPRKSLQSTNATAESVRSLIRSRRLREQFFSADLFADPAWDMLLDLYAARLEDQPVSVSSLCIAATVPATTALRWIKTMTDTGLFIRKADPHDGRRIFIALSDSTADAMSRYFVVLN